MNSFSRQEPCCASVPAAATSAGLSEGRSSINTVDQQKLRTCLCDSRHTLFSWDRFSFPGVPSPETSHGHPRCPLHFLCSRWPGAGSFQAFKPLQNLLSLRWLVSSCLQTVTLSGFGLVLGPHPPFLGLSFLPAQLRIRISEQFFALPCGVPPPYACRGNLNIPGVLSLHSSLPFVLLPRFKHSLSPQTPTFLSPA